MIIKTGKIAKLSRDELIELISTNPSFTAITKKIGISSTGGAIRDLKARLDRENIDYKHINDNWRKFISSASIRAIPINELLIPNSPRRINASIKKRLFKDGLLRNECYHCGISNIWCGKPITLHIDHIDGNHYNNTYTNLRILCPNCHSQTKTYSVAKNISKRPDNLCKCGLKITKRSKLCTACANAIIRINSYNTRKFNPSVNELLNLIKVMPMIAIATKYKVSDTAIRKRCKMLGIDYKKESPFSL